MSVYAVRNDKGFYFRPRGVGNFRTQWVYFADAKLYRKSGPVKGQLTKLRKMGHNIHLIEFELVELKNVNQS